jgi:DNA-binding transcriptional LysR family regulator
MLSGVTLDQLRTFLAAADLGSFSAAGRQLGRAQSVVSQTLANLEARVGVELFDRSGRRPVLTEAGRALIHEARSVVDGMAQFQARAKGLADGLEAELSVVVDVMFPTAVLTEAVQAFQTEFPNTPLRLYVEALGAVLRPVLDGRCSVGILGSLPRVPVGITERILLGVRLEIVAARSHPLAAYDGIIETAMLGQHVQLVLTDRTDLSQGQEFGVFSQKSWRLADLGAKAAFLRAGLGWGSMPRHAIEPDLVSGALVALTLVDPRSRNFVMPMQAIHRTDAPPGPAGRWLIERLAQPVGTEF